MIKLLNKPKPTVMWVPALSDIRIPKGTTLRCDDIGTAGITLGKTYPVQDSDLNVVRIADDRKAYFWYYNSHFSILKEVPE